MSVLNHERFEGRGDVISKGVESRQRATCLLSVDEVSFASIVQLFIYEPMEGKHL